MDGILLIDKPAGPTSHDVVLCVRRASGESRVGHTGTLDPSATGLLPLVLGQATRLASLLSASAKTYEATVRLGFSTDTDDAEGRALGEASEVVPTDDAIARALDRLRGTFEQMPPDHSAKRVGGAKAYDLARRSQPVTLKAVTVTVHALDLLSRTGDLLTLRLTATAGFYVRALARDLGADLGCGAHLAALRRTMTGVFDVRDAIGLDEAARMGAGIGARLLTPSDALPNLAVVHLTELGLRRAVHGNSVGPEHLDERAVPPAAGAGPVKILGPDGRLVALAHSRGGALHPVVVLG